jgi:hypothetical protein
MAYVAYFRGYKGLTARTQVRLHTPKPCTLLAESPRRQGSSLRLPL